LWRYSWVVLQYLVPFQMNLSEWVSVSLQPLLPLEYAIPVGVWQIREGVRAAMKQKPTLADSFEKALDIAVRPMSISTKEWLAHGDIIKLMRQKTISDFF